MLRSDCKYVYCLLKNMSVSGFNVAAQLYFLLWLTTFVDSGYFENEAESKKFISTCGVVTIFVSMAFLSLFGMIVDKVSAHILSPISLLFRPCFIIFFLLFVNEPNWLAIFSLIGMSIGTFLQ